MPKYVMARFSIDKGGEIHGVTGSLPRESSLADSSRSEWTPAVTTHSPGLSPSVTAMPTGVSLPVFTARRATFWLPSSTTQT